MRPRFLPPPSPEAWESIRIHELVRDYPELLPLLGEVGTLWSARGAQSLGEMGGVTPEALETMRAAVAWRA